MAAKDIIGLFALGAIAVAAAAGCSSSGASGAADASAAAPDGNQVACTNDPSVDPALGPGAAVALPFTKSGKAGALSFVLTGLLPNPAAENTNTWTMKILDGSGNPAANAALSFPANPAGGPNPWMPRMGHGSISAQAQRNADGTYAVGPLYLPMAGVWQLIVAAQAGSVTDTATFTFCVP